MNPPIFTLNINNIHGASAFLDSEKVRLKFRSSLSIDSWHMLLKSIDEFVEGGLLRWEFDLSELQYPGSTDIGMWVTCGARIKHSAGRVTFLVRRSSQVHSLLELTRLFEIFDVDLLD